MSICRWKIKTCISSHHRDFCVELCAICRRFLNDRCVECEANRPDEVDQSLNDCVARCKSVLFTLLLCRKRQASLLFGFDLNLLKLIFQWTCGHVECPDLRCPQAMVCSHGHMFHQHCWMRWSVKRNKCPLDNLEPFKQVVCVSRFVRTLKCEVVAINKR